MTSTITPDGRLVPVVATGVAVKDLVSGVTRSLEEVTSAVTGGGTVLDDTVKGVTGTVDGVTKGLTDPLTASPSANPLPKNWQPTGSRTDPSVSGARARPVGSVRRRRTCASSAACRASAGSTRAPGR